MNLTVTTVVLITVTCSTVTLVIIILCFAVVFKICMSVKRDGSSSPVLKSDELYDVVMPIGRNKAAKDCLELSKNKAYAQTHF